MTDDLPARVDQLAARVVATARPAETPPEPGERVPVGDDVDQLSATAHDRTLQQTWARRVPTRFRSARLNNVDPSVLHELIAWSTPPVTGNLVLLGPVGTGKTYAAFAVMREVLRYGGHPEFYPVVELLDALRPGGPEGAMEQLATVGVLVVDDLGSERPTEWTAERLYSLVNRRWMDELPTVATTNLEPEELPTVLGERTYSRLVGDAVVLRLTGDDRRLV